MKNKIEVMELSDLHHPSCKLNQSRQGSFEDDDIEPDDLDEDMDDDRYVCSSALAHPKMNQVFTKKQMQKVFGESKYSMTQKRD